MKLASRRSRRTGCHVKPGQYLPAAIVLESDGAQNRGTATPQQAANLAKAAGIRDLRRRARDAEWGRLDRFWSLHQLDSGAARPDNSA